MSSPEAPEPVSNITPEVVPLTIRCLRLGIVRIEDARDEGAEPEEIEDSVDKLSPFRGEFRRLECPGCSFNVDAIKSNGDWVFSFSNTSLRGIDKCLTPPEQE